MPGRKHEKEASHHVLHRAKTLVQISLLPTDLR